MTKLTRARRDSVTVKPNIPVANDKEQNSSEMEEHKSELEEYKLAIQVQQGYYDLVYKSVTIYLTLTALSVGFVFREGISDRLKLISSWFNFAMSLFFVLAFTGFLILSRRLARRMDKLALTLSFELPHHHGLSYGILLTLISGTGGWLFWILTLIFRLWASG
jgi:hypothetical protein